jgi:hypothetical protein
MDRVRETFNLHSCHTLSNVTSWTRRKGVMFCVCFIQRTADDTTSRSYRYTHESISQVRPDITQYRFRKRGGLERTNVNNSIHDDHAYGAVVGRTRGCMLASRGTRTKNSMSAHVIHFSRASRLRLRRFFLDSMAFPFICFVPNSKILPKISMQDVILYLHYLMLKNTNYYPTYHIHTHK